MSDYLDNVRALQAKLAAIGVRVFRVTIGGVDGQDAEWWLHLDKCSTDFRADITRYLRSPDSAPDAHPGNPRANLHGYLTECGYCGPDDVLADTWEGRIATYHAELRHGGWEEECPTEGFGHFGWESND